MATNNRLSLFHLEQQVEASLLVMDPNLKNEYQRALELIPERVRAEAKIADFLRAENYNPTHAAQRIARYWKTRKIIFGDRW